MLYDNAGLLATDDGCCPPPAIRFVGDCPPTPAKLPFCSKARSGSVSCAMIKSCYTRGGVAIPSRLELPCGRRSAHHRMSISRDAQRRHRQAVRLCPALPGALLAEVPAALRAPSTAARIRHSEKSNAAAWSIFAQSRAAGHGILIAPNHCHPADPFVVSELARQRRRDSATRWRAGICSCRDGSMPGRSAEPAVFSIYREGMDRAAIAAATEILTRAERPLVIFPEGVISRSNDRLNALMEGTALIARSAAKKRARATPPGRSRRASGGIALHVSRFDRRGPRTGARRHRGAPLVAAATPAVAARTHHQGGPGSAGTQGGGVSRRDTAGRNLPARRTTDQSSARAAGAGVAQAADRRAPWSYACKKLRTAILPDLVSGEISADERERRWRQLADLYLAQQMSCYPPDYIRSNPRPDRMLETVERFEEDLTDTCRVYRPMKVTVTVGPAIPVSPTRDRAAAEDPVMTALQSQLEDYARRSPRQLSDRTIQPRPDVIGRMAGPQGGDRTGDHVHRVMGPQDNHRRDLEQRQHDAERQQPGPLGVARAASPQTRRSPCARRKRNRWPRGTSPAATARRARARSYPPASATHTTIA